MNRGDVSLRLLHFHQQSDLSSVCKKKDFPLIASIACWAHGKLKSVQLLRSVSLAEWFWTPCGTGEEKVAFSETLPSCYATRCLLIWLSFTMKIIYFPKSITLTVSLSEVVIQAVRGMHLTCLCHTAADMVAHWKSNLQPNWKIDLPPPSNTYKNKLFELSDQIRSDKHSIRMKLFIWAFYELPLLC